MVVANVTRNIEISSNGVWEGDNPLDYAFPLLIAQTTLIIFITRLFAFLFKPLRQPKVIAEILGGIILGPSAFGRNQEYMHLIFPTWSTPILETISSIGLLFFLFLVGLELDLSSIKKSGKKAFAIAAAGISLPFILAIGLASIFLKVIHDENKVGFIQYVVFMGVSLSITAFPVLARILAELKLLNSRVGETAMAAAAFNDVVAWVLLALAIALSGGSSRSPLVSIWVLVCGVAFVAFMLLVIKPVMNWMSKNHNGTNNVDKAYICLTLSGEDNFDANTGKIGPYMGRLRSKLWHQNYWLAVGPLVGRLLEGPIGHAEVIVLRR
ncbi:transporter [Lithospermum erythrorhizon]|uniref:Transporter n=1 Tax=Lithospermum erythrorhizon TaxID=34254 RepID=A0AAV3Q7N3_LITER